jgi:hypothetical protein
MHGVLSKPLGNYHILCGKRLGAQGSAEIIILVNIEAIASIMISWSVEERVTIAAKSQDGRKTVGRGEIRKDEESLDRTD